jgi:hypothetical protein
MSDLNVIVAVAVSALSAAEPSEVFSRAKGARIAGVTQQ